MTFDVDRRASVVAVPNNTQYVIAVVVMAAMGLLVFTALAIARPMQDLLVVAGVITGFTAPTTLALLGFLKAQETHLSVNSRLDAFMANARLAAHAQGVTEGRKEGRDAADSRTDLLADRANAPIAPAALASSQQGA
jgi:hypothetical protein